MTKRFSHFSTASNRRTKITSQNFSSPMLQHLLNSIKETKGKLTLVLLRAQTRRDYVSPKLHSFGQHFALVSCRPLHRISYKSETPLLLIPLSGKQYCFSNASLLSRSVLPGSFSFFLNYFTNLQIFDYWYWVLSTIEYCCMSIREAMFIIIIRT